MPCMSSAPGGSPGHSHTRISPTIDACGTDRCDERGTERSLDFTPRARRYAHARDASSAAPRLRVARPALALQRLRARVRMELRDAAPPAGRLLPALRRPARPAPAHRDGGAELRGVPLRRPASVDVLLELAARRRVVDPHERRDREEGAPAAAAPAGGERPL